MSRKYVRVELSRLRELELVLADPVAFSKANGHDFEDQHCRAFSIGWAGSLVKHMLQDAGERESSSPGGVTP